MKDHRYAVYIMASRSHNFYVGVTNDIARRVRQHKEHVFEGFTAKYNIDRLVWYQIYGDIREAIAREKRIKGWRREKKIGLIESMNPTWQDLSEEWGKPILPLPANRRSLGSGDQTPVASARDDSLKK
ncbi:MAG: GIY-YIG nuclease family protein [Candidatus Korobacteraceae bacterium]